MSFHSSLIASAVWPADLVTAGVVTVATQVHTGRRPQAITDRRGEVWLERLEDPPSEGGGFQHVRRHAYLVHVLYPLGNQGGDKAGKALLDVVEARMQTIKERYDAAIPFVSTFTGMLPVVADEESADTDPEAEVIDGTVRVTFSVKE